MTLNKAKGNMYDWVTHTWNPLNGHCPHNCSYCYVKGMGDRYSSIKEKYSGEPRLNRSLHDNLGRDRTIFVCNMTDLFAEGVPDEVIGAILQQTYSYPHNTYLIQTKDPGRALDFIPKRFKNYILGTTIECDIYPEYDISKAPSPKDRALALRNFPGRRTVTIEPIMKSRNPNHLIDMVLYIEPEFVSIGADSFNNGLQEPTREEVLDLIKGLEDAGINVIQKKNLRRLLK